MGADGLELANFEEEGFTVPCNCRYATPPKNGCWRKELNPQPSDFFTSNPECGLMEKRSLLTTLQILGELF